MDEWKEGSREGDLEGEKEGEREDYKGDGKRVRGKMGKKGREYYTSGWTVEPNKSRLDPL